MKNMVKAANRMGNVCEKLTISLSVLLLIAIMASIILGVYVRLFLNGGFVWTDEFARWCLVDSAFIGAAVLIRRGSLVSLDVLVNKLKGKARVIADAVIQAFCIVFIVVFLVQGYLSIPTYLGYAALTMPTNQAIPLIGMELGGILMLVFLLEKLIYDLFILSGGDIEQVLNRNDMSGQAQGGVAE